jgi:hypothetical protein
MSVNQRSEVDYFAILTLLATVLVTIFLIVAALYFSSVIDLKPPSRSESTFLLWTDVVLIIILIALMIYAMFRIFSRPKVVEVSTLPPPPAAPPAMVYQQPIGFTGYYQPVQIQQPMIQQTRAASLTPNAPIPGPTAVPGPTVIVSNIKGAAPNRNEQNDLIALNQ